MTDRTKIFVAGHLGMVGSAIVRQLKQNDSYDIVVSRKEQLDLTNQQQVNDYFEKNQFDQVYLAAAKVGGIHANNEYPADFIYDNLAIQANVINASHNNDVQKLLFLGSSCIYPKFASQPMHESALLTGELEPTNEPYAVAKIAGIKLCESYNRQYGRDYRSIMPTNLYGENDNFHAENSHVIPALLRRFHEAKVANAESVTVWGTGKAMREFLYVDDMAKASVYVMNLGVDEYKSQTKPMLSHINVGTGIDCTIKELVETIKDVVGFYGDIIWDETKPDGTPRKLLDVTRLSSMGWEATISLRDGLLNTYDWYKQNIDESRC